MAETPQWGISPTNWRFAGPMAFEKAIQSDRARINDFLVRTTSIAGRELVSGAGEVLLDVLFPVWFVECPTMSFGGELDVGVTATAGMFPTVSGVVTQWSKLQTTRSNGGYYVGAQIAAVTSGGPGHRVWVHWRAEGKAMTNPAANLGGVGG